MFTRTDQCLQCHATSRTMGVPGLLVRSVVPDEFGGPILRAGTSVTDHRSLLDERWGGWYVTGTHGEQLHMGNQFVDVGPNQSVEMDRTRGANLTDLSRKINVNPYLGKHSDLIALMVLEQQTQLHNLITRVNFETRLALRDQEVVNHAAENPPGTPSESSHRRIDDAVDQLLRFILFVDEEILADPVAGTSDFVKEFEARGPFDSKGRTLRKFGLQRWLFEYPCSYLIYSDAIKVLPREAKTPFYGRLHAILTNENKSDDFRHVSTRDRKAILEILLETHTDLPDYWHADAIDTP